MKKLIFTFVTTLMMYVGTASAIDEGFEYNLITPAITTGDPSKVEVAEMFWYGCPHCNDFEPTLNKWLKTKPKNVNFIRIPAVFRESWIPHARAYYTAEALGVLDKTHSLFFKAVHKDRQRLATKKDIAAFFVSNGVKQVDFDQAWDSFIVQSRVKRAITLTRRSGIKGVPSMLVNGKYRTSASEAGINNPGGASNDDMIKVVNFLVAKEAKQLKPVKK